MRISAALLVLACLAFLACDRQKVGDVVEREGEAPVSVIDEDDAEMIEAIRKARVSLDEFESRLSNPPSTQTYISLKGRFERKGSVEHIWLNDVTVTAEGYRGRIGNEPLDIPDLEMGQEVLLPRADVSDWMAIDDGRLIAGYSVRLLRSRAPPEIRAQFDAANNFIIED